MAVSKGNPLGPDIQTGEIQDGQVTAAKIAALAVTNAKLADGAVDTEELAADAVTAAKIAANQVGTSELDFDPATQSELDSHAGNVDAHHAKFNGSDAVSAVGGEFKPGIYTGDGKSSRTINTSTSAQSYIVWQFDGTNRTVALVTPDGAIHWTNSTGVEGFDEAKVSGGDLLVGNGGGGLNINGREYNYLALG